MKNTRRPARAARSEVRQPSSAAAPRAAAAAAAAQRAAGAGPKGRKVMVLVSLVGVLCLTSLLLLALSPAPLAPGAASSLFAVNPPPSLDVIFDTAEPLEVRRWKYIYIHHSQTPGGSAATLARAGRDGREARDGSGRGPGLADHFVIGNGDGAVDGELQIGQRWARQEPAGQVPGAQVAAGTVSICLVGDFDQTRPTPTQMRRLVHLVDTLRGRLHIPAERIYLLQEDDSTPAGVGRKFPAEEFREQLMP